MYYFWWQSQTRLYKIIKKGEINVGGQSSAFLQRVYIFPKWPLPQVLRIFGPCYKTGSKSLPPNLGCLWMWETRRSWPFNRNYNRYWSLWQTWTSSSPFYRWNKAKWQAHAQAPLRKSHISICWLLLLMLKIWICKQPCNSIAEYDKRTLISRYKSKEHRYRFAPL